mgnify:CR=1 FL=1
MKKRLTAAITTALVVGVASTTFAAANPFVDVPAKHWAYDAVTKLAQAGIVDGYGDGTFRGDKTITRYEMAQIVAKAMTKSDKADATQKAALDKLAVEFSAELNNLGVRVAKLEASQSNIKFTGDVRIRYNEVEHAAVGGQFLQRFRLNMSAAVNDKTTFNGRFVGLNHNEFGESDKDKAFTAIASFTTKDVFNTGVTSTVGRYAEFLGQTGYLVDTTGTGQIDGAKIGFGNALKVTVGYADFKNFDPSLGDTLYAEAKYNTSKATQLSATYLEAKKRDVGAATYDILGAGFTTKFAKNLALTGEYYQNTEEAGDPDAYLGRVFYKGASAAKPQSFGFGVEYRDFAANSTPAKFSGANFDVNGVKGWGVLANYTLAKNIVLEGFQTFNSKNEATGVDTNAERTRVQVNFSF